MAVRASHSPMITMESLLLARERRVQRQQQWLANWQQPLISLTLVTPGAIKDSERYRQVLQQAIACCDQSLQQQGWRVLQKEIFWRVTGSEVFWSVKQTAESIKRAMLMLEDQHPLGRLWDFDVISTSGVPLSRVDFDCAARRCLVCDAAAHVCARSQQHDLQVILNKIDHIIAHGLLGFDG